MIRHPCARVRPCVPCVSRLPRCLTGTGVSAQSQIVLQQVIQEKSGGALVPLSSNEVSCIIAIAKFLHAPAHIHGHGPFPVPRVT